MVLIIKVLIVKVWLVLQAIREILKIQMQNSVLYFGTRNFISDESSISLSESDSFDMHSTYSQAVLNCAFQVMTEVGESSLRTKGLAEMCFKVR